MEPIAPSPGCFSLAHREDVFTSTVRTESLYDWAETDYANKAGSSTWIDWPSSTRNAAPTIFSCFEHAEPRHSKSCSEITASGWNQGSPQPTKKRLSTFDWQRLIRSLVARDSSLRNRTNSNWNGNVLKCGNPSHSSSVFSVCIRSNNVPAPVVGFLLISSVSDANNLSSTLDLSKAPC